MALLIIIELIKIILLSIPTIRSYYIQYRYLQNCRIKHIELDYSMILIIRMVCMKLIGKEFA